MSENENIFDKLIELKKKQLGMEKPAKVAPTPQPIRIRTLGNIDTIVESQRIFNPGLPPTNPNMPAAGAEPVTPAPLKNPPAKMVPTGTAANSDIEGTWGKPEEKK